MSSCPLPPGCLVTRPPMAPNMRPWWSPLLRRAQRLATAKGSKFAMRALLTEAQRLLEDFASTLGVGDEDEDAAAAEVVEVDTPHLVRKRIAAEVKRVEASKVGSYGVLVDARENRHRRAMLSSDASRGSGHKKHKGGTTKGSGGKPPRATASGGSRHRETSHRVAASS